MSIQRLYCPQCGEYLEGGDGSMRDCLCGWQQPQQCECEDTHEFDDDEITTLRAKLAEVERATNEFNLAINHAISLGIEGTEFLRCWREGDWDGCEEFGFSSPMIDAAKEVGL